MRTAVKDLNRTSIDNRTISVDKAKSNKESREHIGYTIHIKNLSFKVAELELFKFCEENYGKVKKVHMVLDDKGKSKGFGFVEFFEEEAMNKAVKDK